MEQVRYSVGELRRIIRESANEFDAKIGPGVKADNVKNNGESYEKAKKNAQNFDGGLKAEKKGELPPKEDYNRTTIDYNPRTKVSKEQENNWKSQAKGYTSKLEEDNDIEKGGAEFDNDGKILKQFTDANDKINKEKTDLAKSGIQGHNLDIKEKNKMINENIKPVAKRLNFKHTKFLNEAQMLNRIPEEYKKDGQVIYMKDSANNEYVVECKRCKTNGLIETNVLSYNNETVLNEQLSRINELFDYKTPNTYAPTSMKVRVDENKGFGDLMDLSRSLIK